MSAPTIRTGPAARRALARDLVAAIAQDMQYLGWFVAIVHAYPESGYCWRPACAAATRARYHLQLAEAVLGRGAQNLRPRRVCGGAISGAQAPAIQTTTRDRTSGRRHGRRYSYGVRASAPRTCD